MPELEPCELELPALRSPAPRDVTPEGGVVLFRKNVCLLGVKELDQDEGISSVASKLVIRISRVSEGRHQCLCMLE